MAKRVVVTGANRGIGLEYARQLAARGDEVIATARRPEEADELRALEGVSVHPLDVTDSSSTRALADAIQAPVDLLINNAGVGVRGRPLGEIEYDRMHRYFDTNTCGPLRVTESLLGHLRAGSGRTIVNMTSKMGSVADNGSGGSYAYRASKAALNIVNRSLAHDLADEGFICVVLHPGWVQTEMGGGAALLTPAESVSGLLEVIDGLDRADSGRFFDNAGQEVPW